MKNLLPILGLLYLFSCSSIPEGFDFHDPKLSKNKYNLSVIYHETGEKKLFPIPRQYDWKIPIGRRKGFSCWITGEKKIREDRYEKEFKCFQRSGAEFAMNITCNEGEVTEGYYFIAGYKGEKEYTLGLECNRDSHEG